MDESLFQLVTVGLLGVTLLVLLVTLLTLNKLAKKIEEGSPARAEAPNQHGDRVGEPPGLVALAPDDHETGTPSPAETSTFPATAVTSQEHAAHQREQQADSAPARAEEPQAAGVEDEPAPEPQPSVATEGAQQESQPAQGTGFEDAPEEQPFERDGRWWFKRGDELLVYDEQSGQWESAPANTSVSRPVPPLVPGADSGSGHSSTTQAAGGQAEPDQSAQDPGSFWKCTSCGAVNGSTATSCRMCFAPKP